MSASATRGRIDTIFAELRASGRKALMPFVTGGYPTLEVTEKVIPALEAVGAGLGNAHGVAVVLDRHVAKREDLRAIAPGLVVVRLHPLVNDGAVHEAHGSDAADPAAFDLAGFHGRPLGGVPQVADGGPRGGGRGGDLFSHPDTRHGLPPGARAPATGAMRCEAGGPTALPQL